MINVLASLAMMALLTVPASQHSVGDSNASHCPSESARMRSNVMWFLTRPEFAVDREKLGLAVGDARAVRLLSKPSDAEVCARLEEIMGRSAYGASPYRRAYYAAEDFYFVTIAQEHVSGESFSMGHTPTVIVFDRQLRPLHATSRGAPLR